MAILDEVPGLEVEILVNGQPLKEYVDQHAEVPAHTVERYVEAKSNAQFEIHYTFKPPFPADRAVSMIVTMDSHDIDQPIIRPFEMYDPDGHLSIGPVSNVGSRWMLRRYCFSALKIREADAEIVSEDLKEKLRPVGIITCEFYYLDNPQQNRHIHGAHKDIEELPPVSEKAIKGEALSHQAILGDIEPTDEVEYFDADYAEDGEPFATFHFYYRSLEALKNLHIVERTPEPTAFDLLDSGDDIISQLNGEQLEAMIRRFREQAETNKRIKRERSSSSTIIGDDSDVGDPYLHSDPDVIEMRWVDLRKQRKENRVRQLPTPDAEVIEIE